MHPPKIAACLIVKNSADVIEKCLASVRPHVDGVFVYDTGSTDGTVEIIERLNLFEGIDDQPLAPITVERGEWRQDFSWAREQSFAMPDESYDWLLWLDDDDEILGGQNLRDLAQSAHPQVHGLTFLYDYAQDESGNSICQLWRERLVRRSANYRWVQPVHEVYVPQEGAPAHLQPVPPSVCRWKHNRPADRYAPSRNLDILMAELERHKEAQTLVQPRILAYLGTEHMAQGDFATAAGWLDKYLEHPNIDWSDERCQVRHKLALCMRALGNPMAAIDIEFQSIRERDTWTENSVGLAASFAALGDWQRAEHWARQAQKLGMPQSPLILNPVEINLFPLLVIADACVNTGRYDEAREAIRQAAEVAPGPMVEEKQQQIEVEANRAELVGAVMLIREVLMRHDETLKAHGLMQAVPYLIEDDPRIVAGRAHARDGVLHALNPDEYDRWYRDEAHETPIPDEAVFEADEWRERAGYMVEGLAEQETELGRKPVAIDLGCHDHWLGCFLWQRAGVRVDGIELNAEAVEMAKDRADKFGVPCDIHQGNLHDAVKLTGGRKYDAVCLFEVLEHVPDMDRTLAVCEQLLAPGGRVYLTTPNGAFSRGQRPDWAAPGRQNHLRALTASQLSDLLLSRGKIDTVNVHAEGRVTFVAYKPRPVKSKIAFYLGQQWEPWSAASLRNGGIGGSETAAVQVATRLARKGHHVRVFSSSEPGLAGGVLYRPFTAWDPTEDVDLLVVSRLAHVFDNPIGAKQTALWCHDHSYPEALTPERVAKIDHVVTLTDWQAERFARLYPYAKDRIRVIRNGIALYDADGTSRYQDAHRPFDYRKPRVVFSSSADRGLDTLLDLWPRIRAGSPSAELHVFYGWNTLDAVAIHNPDLAAFKLALLQKVEKLGGEEGGVFMRGRVGQAELAEEMMQATVLAYPTAFLETSCITAMEARAAGLPIVTSALGALNETVGDHGILIPWGPDEDEPCNRTGEYRNRFVEQTLNMLRSEQAWAKVHQAGLQGVDGLDWDNRIPDWEALIAGVREQEVVAA